MSNGGRHSIEIIIRDGTGRKVMHYEPRPGNVRHGMEIAGSYIRDHLGIYSSSRNPKIEAKINNVLRGKVR